MPQKGYDADTIAHALAVVRAEGNLKRASAITGISRSTLRGWAAGNVPSAVAAEGADALADKTDAAGAELAKGYREVESAYREHLLKPEVVAKATAAQAAIVVGVMSDKATRAEGGPTSISESRQVRISLVEPDALRSDNLRVIEGGKKREGVG